MKVDVSRDVETNISGAIDFKVSDNAYKIFSMLSNYLYSDKEFAVLYELSANAHDEHVISGKADVPFDITLPTRLDNKFRIRDFGRGLSESDVTKLLATYGESTKTASNLTIGGWGIGFKSVAAVSSTWNVISMHDGERKEYLIFINEQGIPALTRIKVSETDETGIEIVIPIPTDKISLWEQLVTRVYKHFPVKPHFTNKTIRFDTEKAILEGSCWKLINRGGYYDAKRSTFISSHREYVPDSSKVDPKYAFLLGLPFDVQFDIGEMELSISREQLQYTKHTVDGINAKLKIVYDEMIALIVDGLSVAKDELEYRELVFKVLKTLFGDKYSFNNCDPVKRLFKEAIAGKYKIINIPEDVLSVVIPITGKVQAFNGKTLSECKTGWNCWKTHHAYFHFDPKTNTSTLKVKVGSLDRLEFYHKDAYDGGSRLRGNHTHGKYMFLLEQKTVPDIFKKKLLKVSSLPKTPRVVQTKTATTGDYYSIWRNSYQRIRVNTATGKYAYIFTGNFRDHSELEAGVYDHMQYLKLHHQYTIITIKRKDTPPAGIKHVKDAIAEVFTAIKTNPDLKKEDLAFAAYRMFDNNYGYNTYSHTGNIPHMWKFVSEIETTGTSLWNDKRKEVEDVLKFAKSVEYSQYRMSTPLTGQYNELARLMGEPEIQHSFTLNLKAMLKEILAQYPLLKYCASGWEVLEVKDYLEMIGK